MLRVLKLSLKWFAIVFFAAVAAIAVTGEVLYRTADMGDPHIEVDTAQWPVIVRDGYTECGPSRLRRSDSGLWELYLSGDAVQRGVAHGRLCGELLDYQEQVFMDGIHELVPSDTYLGLLRRLVVIFNRRLGGNVPQEQREEIAGVALGCSHRYDAIGTPYERQINYHAAHDIGHAMQEYMLVGCSSFGVWGSQSADSSLLVGRNFDFYVGDDFARNKLVTFCAPDEGHRFVSIGWAGMTGVLSGMNECGLTVTLNAAKGPLPTSSARPISLLAREILQYASTVDEAFSIAERCRTFVSESILIGSAADGYAAIIEKSPEHTALFRPDGERVICTNHYQSADFADDDYNRLNIAVSDSPYRFERLEELLDARCPLDPEAAVAVLRDRYGRGGEDIGLCNEKTVNQSIAHHSVVFCPERLLVWVSTSPWQSGRFVCYDLHEVFADPDFSEEIRVAESDIAADSLFLQHDYPRVTAYREAVARVTAALRDGVRLPDGEAERLIATNPEHYYVYDLAGRYEAETGRRDEAARLLREALRREIPRLGERENIEKRLKRLEK